MSSNANKASISVTPSAVSFGDTVDLTWSVPDNVKDYPVVYVKAFQNGTLVFAAGGYPPINSCVLGPSQLWTGGPADGRAEVGTFDAHTGREKILAEVDFPIDA